MADATATGSFFDGATVAYESNMSGADFSYANLTGARILGGTLSKIKLNNAILKDATLSGSDLVHAHLNNADLRGAVFVNANLGWAELKGSDLRGSFMPLVRLNSAKLSGANLEEATLWGARMSTADLSGANLEGSYMVGASCNSCDFTGASLNGTDVRKAEFRGAYFKKTRLGDIDVTRAKSWESAIFSEIDWTKLEKTDISSILKQAVIFFYSSEGDTQKQSTIGLLSSSLNREVAVNRKLIESMKPIACLTDKWDPSAKFGESSSDKQCLFSLLNNYSELVKEIRGVSEIELEGVKPNCNSCFRIGHLDY